MTSNQQYSSSFWYKKVKEFLTYELPVGIIYLTRGVKVSTTVLIRDVLSEGGIDYIILANGSLIPLASVINIYNHPQFPSTKPNLSYTDEEIFNFQLPS